MSRAILASTSNHFLWTDVLSVTHNIVIVLLQRYSKGSDFNIMEFMEIILFVGQEISID